MNLLAASSFETLLIALGIILLSAVSNWVQRRRQAQRQESGNEEAKPTTLPPSSSRDSHAGPAPPAPHPGLAPAPPPAAPKPPRRLSWEEELRRLLEGELEPAPPPQSHPPPPVATPPSREAVSPPPLRPAAFEAEEAKGLGYVPGRCANCGGRFEFPSASAGKVILCPHCRHPIPLVPLPALSLSPVMSSKELGEPAQAIHRASHLHEHVGDRLRQTAARTGRPLVSVPPPRRTTTSTEVIDTVGMLRHSRSARQLMIAAVVLGPPRGLERYT